MAQIIYEKYFAGLLVILCEPLKWNLRTCGGKKCMCRMYFDVLVCARERERDRTSTACVVSHSKL